MKLGVSTFAYGWAIGVPGSPPARPMDAVAFVRRAAEHGVRLVQIADNLPLHALTEAQREELRGETERLGMAVEVGARGIRPEVLTAYLEIACRFRSPILRTLIDTADDHPDIDEAVDLLCRAMPDFEAAGVVLAIENHDRFTSRQYVEIVERVGGNSLGLCLDTVNSFGALEGPEVVVETLAPYTVNLHLKEFTIRRAGHMMGFVIEGAPAGRGRLDVRWLLDRLRAHGCDVNAILEQWTPPEPDVEATIAKEAAWAAESVAYLRALIPD